jgi:hypothetical protein
MRAQPSLTPMHRGRRPACSCRHPLTGVDGPERPSGRSAFSGITPPTIMSPTRSHPGPWTEIRPGARAHHPAPATARTHPQPPTSSTTATRTPRLTERPCTDKEQRRADAASPVAAVPSDGEWASCFSIRKSSLPGRCHPAAACEAWHCVSNQIAAPFRLLHDSHRSSRVRAAFEPPCETGMM